MPSKEKKNTNECTQVDNNFFIHRKEKESKGSVIKMHRFERRLHNNASKKEIN